MNRKWRRRGLLVAPGVALPALVTCWAVVGRLTPAAAPPESGRQIEAEGHGWRRQRAPRIDAGPDPERIRVEPDADGLAWVTGTPRAAGERTARLARVVNLSTGDEVVTGVREDGAFRVRMPAPPGSWLQINTSMMPPEDLPPEIRDTFERTGAIALTDIEGPPAEWIRDMVAGNVTSSPATIIRVSSPANAFPFVRRIGPRFYCFGLGRLTAPASPRERMVELDMEVRAVFETEAQARAEVGGRIGLGFGLRSMFDAQGRQRPSKRLSAAHVLTPTGLPIETHGEMLAEPRPDGTKRWGPAGAGWPLGSAPDTPVTTEIRGRTATIRSRPRLMIPPTVPDGIYAVDCHIEGLFREGYAPPDPAGGPTTVAVVRVGAPLQPRLACILLGSEGAGGSRGTQAVEDRGSFALNPRNVAMPERLIIPRDDPYTGELLVRALDPHAPLVSLADRPFKALPSPVLPLVFEGSSLTVTITGPDGSETTLGPAPLVSARNDLSVLRPDLVVQDRIVPPRPPTYGNPSLSDMLHLTGGKRFEHAFRLYGEHTVRMSGHISDVVGNRYAIGGTYKVYVARPIHAVLFPEPGTPLEPGVKLAPQARLYPPMPANVEFSVRHFPLSDTSRMIERTIKGRANRWGVYVADPERDGISFADPGEYVCDFTATYADAAGTIWMASRKGASVVVTPDSRIIAHGERGNRTPGGRWRARWFVAGDGQFITERPERAPEPGAPPPGIELGHTCLPYEHGDVAWLGAGMEFSLFPGITFEDPVGAITALIEKRWPGLAQGDGREGLYPYKLKPEDRRAIGEMPYVCMTAKGLPPSMDPGDVDQWGYFYTTSWRPGLGVRTQVAEDLMPVGYWFFDEPYGFQPGVGPAGDLPGDVKMTYAGGVFRDIKTGTTSYDAYASMLTLIGRNDKMGPRVLPPFNGLVPGSPPCGPLLEMDGRKYDVFLTFGAVAPGAVLETGDRLSVAGVVWPPTEGEARVTLTSPTGRRRELKARAAPTGVFDCPGPIPDEPGLWRISATGICSGRTSLGVLSSLLPEAKWPRGPGIGVPESGFPLPVTRPGSTPIAFDVPRGARARPPRPVILRGRLPAGVRAERAGVIVSMPGQMMEHLELPVRDGAFEYVYDAETLSRRFPNLDTRLEEGPADAPRRAAWFDTVTCTFYAGQGSSFVAGMVALEGEDIYTLASTGAAMPTAPMEGRTEVRPHETASGPDPSEYRASVERRDSPHSSLVTLSSRGDTLYAAHPYSGEIARVEVPAGSMRLAGKVRPGGEPSSIALSPDGRRIYASLASDRRVVALDAVSLRTLASWPVPCEPLAVLASTDGAGVFVAGFDAGRVLRVHARTGRVEATSAPINRPAALARQGDEVYAVSFRTGEILVMDARCRELRRLRGPASLNQCRALTVGPDGLLYAPQTRSDTRAGGRVFDRTVFPVIASADPRGSSVAIRHVPDLLVPPPHRPSEVALDDRSIYLASAGTDDVLAISRRTGFAEWHAMDVGKEPIGLALDEKRGRLYVVTGAGQEIVGLEARTGRVTGRLRYAHDQTQPNIARGRYLFGTATDTRLTKDRWMSCAVCHPRGEADGRQWDMGAGPLDTATLRGCLSAKPLHVTGHLDEIQDTYRFTRMVMAGQWFIPLERMNPYLGRSNAGLDSDLDALSAYIGSLRKPDPPPIPAALLASVRRGEALFESPKTGCLSCHPPPLYTDSGRRDAGGRFVLHDVGTGRTGSRYDTPSLLGLARTEPYLHDGRARSLEEALTRHNTGDRHGRTSHLSRDEARALATFLKHLQPRSAAKARQGRRPSDRAGTSRGGS